MMRRTPVRKRIDLDERMAYYDTEELWFPEWEHGGTPSDAKAPANSLLWHDTVLGWLAQWLKK